MEVKNQNYIYEERADKVRNSPEPLRLDASVFRLTSQPTGSSITVEKIMHLRVVLCVYGTRSLNVSEKYYRAFSFFWIMSLSCR